MRYYFYSKNDKNKEPIMFVTINDGDISSAIDYFSNIKNMDLEVFLSIYSVSEYES